MRKPLSQLKSYQALASHAQEIKSQTIQSFFENDQNRFDSFSTELGPILVDYSKNHILPETITKLVALHDECDVPIWRDKMFAGEKINNSEQRAVQHIALRDLEGDSEISKSQSAVLENMQNFCEEVYAGEITDVVNIGIGGSHLGPMLVCDALSTYANNNVKVHFVSNVDATEMERVLVKLNPANTLFIVTSKSFTTQETLTNAETAKQWFMQNPQLAKNIDQHFVAVTANVEQAKAFGVNDKYIFPMWDEIGGRYSLWSAVGLSIALYIGMSNFKQLLQGANEMDRHFTNQPANENLPVLLALIDLWYQQFFSALSYAVLPYDVRLRYLPFYLQQLVMESNGKSVDRDDNPLEVSSSPVVFGDVGTNAQHSFFQLLHQGTHYINCDFIGVVKPVHINFAQHEILMSNLMSQTQALMQGQNEISGNRPSTTIFLQELTPHSLGMLLAMYEHKVFAQGIILNINSFDQMGVELGKRLASSLVGKIKSTETIQDEDLSTNGLINFYKKYR